MNWLITGGGGFIGRNLIKRLGSEEGHRIRIIDDFSTSRLEDLSKLCSFTEVTGVDKPFSSEIELQRGTILDEELSLQTTKGADVIVHLAANTGVAPSVADPRSDCVTNVIGTLNYLEAARINGVDRFVFASSGAPAGECTPPIHEELPPHPVSPYGASKLSGEGYCSAYYRTFGIQTVCLRFSNVYGPLSTLKNSVVAKFIKKSLNNEPLEVYGDGNQTRDFIFVDDLVEAIYLAATKSGIGGETFQIATAQETTINELIDELVQQFKILFPNLTLHISYADPLVGDVLRNFSDTTKAYRKLGWQSETDLPDGLEQTIKWFYKQLSSEG